MKRVNISSQLAEYAKKIRLISKQMRQRLISYSAKQGSNSVAIKYQQILRRPPIANNGSAAYKRSWHGEAFVASLCTAISCAYCRHYEEKTIEEIVVARRRQKKCAQRFIFARCNIEALAAAKKPSAKRRASEYVEAAITAVAGVCEK